MPRWSLATLTAHAAPGAAPAAEVRARTAAAGRGDGASGRSCSDAALLPSLRAASIRGMRSGRWSPRAVSGVLWAACRLDCCDEELAGAAVALLTPKVADAAVSEPRALATCLWALVAAGHPRQAGPLLAAAVQPAARRVPAFDDQSLSNLLWAYGSSGTPAAKLFAAAAPELARRCASMNLQSLANCVWAFAASGNADLPLMAAVGAALAEAPAQPGTPPPVTPGASTGARGQDRPGKEAPRRSGAGSRMRAGPAAGAEAEGRVRLGARVPLKERLEECGRPLQSLSMLAWSYATLAVFHRPLLTALLAQAAARCTEALAGAAADTAAERNRTEGPGPVAADGSDRANRRRRPGRLSVGSVGWRELCNLLYSAAKLLPDLGSTHPGVLQALLAAVDTLVGQQQGPRSRAPAGDREAERGVPGSNPESARDGADDATDTDGGGAAGRAVGSGELALLCWSVAVLCPASPTLRRLLAEAVAAAGDGAGGQRLGDPSAASGGAGGDSERDGGSGDDAGALAGAGSHGPAAQSRGGAAAWAFHPSGLRQLYTANYAQCLAAAAAGGTSGAATGGGGPSCLFVVTQQAAAMRSAHHHQQQAAAAAAADEGSGPVAGTEPVPGPDQGPLFGPLAAEPRLFRACRDAWLANTAVTSSSALHEGVMAALRSRLAAATTAAVAADDDDNSLEAADVAPATEAAGALPGSSCAPQPQRGVVAAVAEEVYSPDRMQRVDVLVLYDGWLVLLQVDGPSHFCLDVQRHAAAAERSGSGTGPNVATRTRGSRLNGSSGTCSTPVPAAEPPASASDSEAGLDAGAGPGRDGVAAAELRPLGDTLLRDWLLAASLGARDGWSSPGAMMSGDTTVRVPTPHCDPWVVQGLLEHLGGPSSAHSGSGGPGVCLTGPRDTSTGSRGGCGGFSADEVRGLAMATVSYTEWRAAGGDTDGGATCLEALLDRAVGRPAAAG